MTETEFKRRTKQVGLRILRLVDALPRTRSADAIARQLVRSGTSIGANYRAACRARSAADMNSKLGIVEEEADETMYWIELLGDGELVPERRLVALRVELGEILAMIVASRKTLGSVNQKSKIKNQK